MDGINKNGVMFSNAQTAHVYKCGYEKLEVSVTLENAGFVA